MKQRTEKFSDFVTSQSERSVYVPCVQCKFVAKNGLSFCMEFHDNLVLVDGREVSSETAIKNIVIKSKKTRRKVGSKMFPWRSTENM